MKILLPGLFLCCFYFSVFAQNGPPNVSVKFKKEGGRVIYFQYGKSIDDHIALDTKGRMQRSVTDTGFYSIVNAGNVLRVYLEPGMDLSINKKIKKGNTIYTFSGKGKRQNTFLNHLAAEQTKYLPVKWNLLSDDVNFMAPPDFIKRLEQYRSVSLALIAKQPFSNYFKVVHAAYIDCLTRKFALQYMENYGVNPARKKEYIKALENGDASLNTREGKQAALDAVYTKELTYDDRRAVFSYVYNGFNINNEALYKCSAEYCDLIDGWINYRAQTTGGGGNSFADRRIDIIKDNITNRFMQKRLLAKYLARN